MKWKSTSKYTRILFGSGRTWTEKWNWLDWITANLNVARLMRAVPQPPGAKAASLIVTSDARVIGRNPNKMFRTRRPNQASNRVRHCYRKLVRIQNIININLKTPESLNYPPGTEPEKIFQNLPLWHVWNVKQ